MNSTTAFVWITVVIDLIWLLSLIGLPFLMNAMLMGVYVPPQERSLPQLRAIRLRFLMISLSGALLGGLLSFAAYRLSDGSEGWTLSCLLVLQAAAVIAAWAFSRRQALALKAQRGWKAPDSSKRTAYIGTDTQKNPAGIRAWAYLLHVAIIALCALLTVLSWDRIPDLVPMHFDAAGLPDRYAAKSVGSVFTLNLLQILITGLFAGIHFSVGRTRQNLDPADPRGSLRKQTLFRGANAYVLYTLSLVVVLMFGWIQARSTYDFRGTLPIGYALAFLLLLTVMLAAFFIYLKKRGLDDMGTNRHHGEDRYWRGGAFYCNPQDPAIMVEKRIGFGWTFNFARPASWLILAAILFLPAAAIVIAFTAGS